MEAVGEACFYKLHESLSMARLKWVKEAMELLVAREAREDQWSFYMNNFRLEQKLTT